MITNVHKANDTQRFTELWTKEMTTLHEGGRYQTRTEMYFKPEPTDDKKQRKQMSIDKTSNKNKQ